MGRAVFIIMFCLAVITQGQERVLKIPRNSSGNVVPWYQMQMKLVEILPIDSFQTSEFEWGFRIWTDDQVIELKKQQGKLTGHILSWAYEYSHKNQSTIGTVHHQLEALTAEQTFSLKNLLQYSQVMDIHDETEIDNWLDGNDGVTYCIETVDTNTYTFKSYREPDKQDSSVSEAIALSKFIDQLTRKSNAVWYWKRFTDGLSFPCYKSAGPFVTCSVKMVNYGTRKERRQSRRKVRRVKETKH